MIVYQLMCADGHRFESWFQNGVAFDRQQADSGIECPFCGIRAVSKAPMAPRVARAPRGSGGGENEGRTQDQQIQGREVEGGKIQGGEIRVRESEGRQSVASGLPAEMLEALRRLRHHVETKCDFVGPAFPEEARRIFYGESDHRDIYGEASAEDAEALQEEGIEVQRIPWLVRRDS